MLHLNQNLIMLRKNPRPTQLPSQLLELAKALYPYKRKLRKKGKGLDYILTKEELKSIEIYLKTGSYEISANKMNTNAPMFFITIKNIIAKLNIFRHLQ